MKCVVLAGGAGDRMWPLSRREYPKQFMNIREDRSLLQETIGRNMSLCEEFFIMANAAHGFIVDGQMEVFQGIKYRGFYEEIGKGTAFPVVMACMSCNPSEVVYVITADHLVEGCGYKSEVVRAIDYAKEGKIAAFGVKMQEYKDNYDYFCLDFDNKIECFVGKRDITEDIRRKENCVVNTGLFVCMAGEFLNNVKKYSSDYYEKCLAIHRSLRTNSRTVKIKKELVEKLENISVEEIMYKNLSDKVVLKLTSRWWEVDSFESFHRYSAEEYERNVIKENSRSVSVINQDREKLVVVNGISDAYIVNTEDALYVTSVENAEKIKEIVEDNEDKCNSYFMHGNTTYRPWGYRELLKKENNFMVRKVVIFPGMCIDVHKHNGRSEHWSVIEGTISVATDGARKDIEASMSAYVPIGVEHALYNDTEENAVLIEVSIGESVSERDMINLLPKKEHKTAVKRELVKLEPVYKDYIWGGTRLREIYNKKCDYRKIAESWELAAHKDGSCIVGKGRYKGRTFNDYLKSAGMETLGWKAQSMDRFPVLIKFIDAKQPLSIQVHPEDWYALKYEGELGKNEMWYIMDCTPGAYLYCGFSRNVTREEVKRRILDNTIIEVLNKVFVKKGDVIFVEAGTIHAVGEGIMLCEVQQNSNCTYRLYDYDRVDDFGNKRKLNLTKALDVLDFNKKEIKPLMFDIDNHIGYNSQLLASCKYFQCVKYSVCEYMEIPVDDTSFKSFIVLSGCGIISLDNVSYEFEAGESYFMPAGSGTIKITGKAELLVTNI